MTARALVRPVVVGAPPEPALGDAEEEAPVDDEPALDGEELVPVDDEPPLDDPPAVVDAPDAPAPAPSPPPPFVLPDDDDDGAAAPLLLELLPLDDPPPPAGTDAPEEPVELDAEEAPPLDPDAVALFALDVGGQFWFFAASSWARAVASACWSVASCCLAVVTCTCDEWRLDAFEACCSAVGPLRADARFASACARLAFAVSSVASADAASSLASFCPEVTCCPTRTFTEVTLPLVEKLAAAERPTSTFPDALTVDCTVPRATVTVRCVAVPDDVLLVNP